MRRFISVLVVALLALMVGAGSAWGDPTKHVFAVHLECEDGAAYDILSPGDGTSFAGLVEGTNSVAVLKGADLDFDGIPDFLVPGFDPANLIACDAFTDESGETVLLFVAYVLFTPRTG